MLASFGFGIHLRVVVILAYFDCSGLSFGFGTHLRFFLLDYLTFVLHFGWFNGTEKGRGAESIRDEMLLLLLLGVLLAVQPPQARW